MLSPDTPQIMVNIKPNERRNKNVRAEEEEQMEFERQLQQGYNPFGRQSGNQQPKKEDDLE